MKKKSIFDYVDTILAILPVLFVLLVFMLLVVVSFTCTNVKAQTIPTSGIIKQISGYTKENSIPLSGICKKMHSYQNVDEHKKPKIKQKLKKKDKQKEVKSDVVGTEKSVPTNNSFKSYMDADTITCEETDQYVQKNNYKLDKKTGIWTVNGRYCIAVGSYYTQKIGTYLDVKMSNGNVIECILAECKDDADTDDTNRQNPNGSIIEFVVNESSLNKMVVKMGNCSYAKEEFKGEIESIIVYD